MPDGPDEVRREPRHPIQVVARRTGLTADTLRAWEKRYGAVTPSRATSSRRLYSDEDVERLLLLRRATEAGRRIGQVAKLSEPELRKLVAQDESAIAEAPAPRARTARPETGSHLEACLDAIRRLDAQRLEELLTRARVELTMPVLVEELLVPLITSVGNGWREGSLGVAHEHLTTSVLRSLLGHQMQARVPMSTDPAVVLSTPSGQHHELGALLAAVTASLEGWRVTYLGPDLPAEEIAGAAKSVRAGCVALSVVYPVDDPRLPDELRKVSRLLDSDVVLLVGGRGSAAHADVIREVGARRIDTLAGLREELGRLRAQAV
jgi:DNA-binding transcriptional MerR regulator/methylmalonyl-CoA mutase cobalamin-binding subunit